MLKLDQPIPAGDYQEAVNNVNSIIAFDNLIHTLSMSHEDYKAKSIEEALLPILASLLNVPLKKENKLFIISSPFVEAKVPDEIKDFTIVRLSTNVWLRDKIVAGYLLDGIIPIVTRVSTFELPPSNLNEIPVAVKGLV